MAVEVAAQPVLDLHAELMQGYELDPWFANADNRQDLRLLDGLWWKGDRIAVPHVKFLCSLFLIWDYHDGPYAGHLGVTQRLHNMQRPFWWPGMFSDMQTSMSMCVLLST